MGFPWSCRLVRGLCVPCQWLWVSTNRTILSHKVCGSRLCQHFSFSLILLWQHPVTLRSFSRAYYGSMNFFGGPSSTSVKASAKLKQLEEENEDAMFVILSDVWLDNVEVLEKLNLMFSGRLWESQLKISDTWPEFSYTLLFLPGYSSMPPTCFIFIGNFSSAPYGNTQIKSLKGWTF